MLTNGKNELAEAARTLMNRRDALSELAREGWMISGPFPRRGNFVLDLKQRFYGFALSRTVH